MTNSSNNSSNKRRYESWGRFPKLNHMTGRAIRWQDDLPDLSAIDASILPVGYGRSYGDSGLNEGGTLLDTTYLRRFIAFDEVQGLLRCESGVMLKDVLDLVVPRGWFLPVSPGTKYVSVGGAIANDVHGKNHHRAGTFGCHVTQFELLRSDGERLLCSPEQNTDLFKATIGGLGLTGLIVWAEFRLRAVSGPYFVKEQIRFTSIEDFFDITDESDRNFEYTASWVDNLATGKNLGRGLFTRGNHDRLQPLPGHEVKPKSLLTIPLEAPIRLLNPFTLWAFNTLLYWHQLPRKTHKVVSYEPFLYPLDFIAQWNLLHGKSGFFQYQCVVPYNDHYRAIKAILTRISQSSQLLPFINVLKTFGDVKSPGLLSFPRPGVTLAVDFPNLGVKTLKLFEELDQMVKANGGAVYPAKDARMSAESFQAYYPNWKEFSRYIDPKFSSSFWRRVTAQPNPKGSIPQGNLN